MEDGYLASQRPMFFLDSSRVKSVQAAYSSLKEQVCSHVEKGRQALAGHGTQRLASTHDLRSTLILRVS